MSRDSEVRRVAAELEAALAALNSAVSDLRDAWLPPEADASKERVAT